MNKTRSSIPKEWFIEKGFRLAINNRNSISIQKAKDSIFSRRLGIRGLRIFGYSILIYINGVDILKKGNGLPSKK